MKLSEEEYRKYFANPLTQRIAREVPLFRRHLRRIEKLGFQSTPEAVRKLARYLPIPAFPEGGDDESKRRHVIVDILSHAAKHALMYVGESAVEPLLEVYQTLPAQADRHRQAIRGVLWEISYGNTRLRQRLSREGVFREPPYGVEGVDSSI
jgi:hypothetical protein